MSNRTLLNGSANRTLFAFPRVNFSLRVKRKWPHISEELAGHLSSFLPSFLFPSVLIFQNSFLFFLIDWTNSWMFLCGGSRFTRPRKPPSLAVETEIYSQKSVQLPRRWARQPSTRPTRFQLDSLKAWERVGGNFSTRHSQIMEQQEQQRVVHRGSVITLENLCKWWITLYIRYNYRSGKFGHLRIKTFCWKNYSRNLM